MIMCNMTSVLTAQSWNVNLNEANTTTKLGTSNNFPLKFYTNNSLRMHLDESGKLGIGTSSPQASMHVIGNGIFSGEVKLQNTLNFSDNFIVGYVAATESNPKMIVNRDWTPGGFSFKYKPPCNVWYGDPTRYNSAGQPYSVPWAPPTSNTWQDLMQIYESGSQSNVVLSMGLLNGDAIISAEPMPTNGTTQPRLKLNPGCSNDVFICEGGGYTKMFNSAGVVGDLNVSNKVKIGPSNSSPQALLDIYGTSTKAISVFNPGSTATNKYIFEVTSSGKTTVGTNIQSNTSMLTIGQNMKNNIALSLTDNSSTTNNDFFRVYGNGYTEINMYSNGIMPSNRVFAILDKTNGTRDLFVVKSDGKVYAREVEITNVQTFPDYVFNKNYQLKSIGEVARYIEKNSHLPGFEKGDHYEKNGINVNQMFIKQQEKIEEQMLYIIQLEKRLSALEKKN